MNTAKLCSDCVNWAAEDDHARSMEKHGFKNYKFDEKSGLFYAARHPCHQSQFFKPLRDQPS